MLIKFFSGLSFRAWAAIVIVLVAVLAVGGFMWHYNGLQEKVVDNAVTIATQGVTIESQKSAIETDSKIDKINEETQVKVEKEVKRQTRQHEAIQTRVEEQTRDIETRFEQLPVTVENVRQEQQQLSTARIDGLWDAYCAAAPDAAECKPNS